MTPNKRLREALKRDQQRQKAERKQARKEKASADKARGTENPEEDPDLAGIIPGPQPQSEETV